MLNKSVFNWTFLSVTHKKPSARNYQLFKNTETHYNYLQSILIEKVFTKLLKCWVNKLGWWDQLVWLKWGLSASASDDLVGLPNEVENVCLRINIRNWSKLLQDKCIRKVLLEKTLMRNRCCWNQVKFITEYTNVQHVIITQI